MVVEELAVDVATAEESVVDELAEELTTGMQ
jgi:hypothetical protein